MKIKKIIKTMTLREKIGQLIQVTPNYYGHNGTITGPIYDHNVDDISWYAGSVLGTKNREQVEEIQKAYLEKSNHKIPLMFMADIIHGYEAIYPIPLALACSWNKNLVEKLSQQAAQESVYHGIDVTFSPMLDYVNDPRWGRVMESFGEDTYLTKIMGKAMIDGYQKEFIACPKHFVGYGASESGRDYNRTNIDRKSLFSKHIAPFTYIMSDIHILMSSFNTIDDIPVSANEEIMNDILRNFLNYDGVVISDWGSIAELISHKVAKDKESAAQIAFENQTDIDMMSFTYFEALEKLVHTGVISESKIDISVERVLRLKEKLGLFENAYRFIDSYPENTNDLLLEGALESIVLLENNGILPLNNKVNIDGPLCDSKDLLGSWSYEGKKEKFETLKKYLDKNNMLSDESETVLYILGENDMDSGEARSKTNINISEYDVKKIKEYKDKGKKVVAIVHGGRPLILTELRKHVDALVFAWHLGHYSSAALYRVLLGKVDFTGRLAMSFPYTIGQIPIYYDSLPTGRPVKETSKKTEYVSQYLDAPNTPLYPFGYGLSYAIVEVESILLSNTDITGDDEQIEVGLKNNSAIETKAVLQVYIEALCGKVSRPRRELILFEKVKLDSYERKTVILKLTRDAFLYTNHLGEEKAESGEFNLYIGFDSNCENKISISYKEEI